MKLFLRISMRSIGKIFLLLLVVILAASSLMMAKPAFAQTPTPSAVPTPSVPIFTVQLVGPPYIVPTTYSLNQSTGQIVAQIGYTNEYSDVMVTILNQPDTSNYDIQIKDHNQTDNWGDLYTTEGGNNYPMQTIDSDYTNISISIWELSLEGRQIDIQVQAMYGYVYNANPYSINGNYIFSGETSAWSPTQTVTIPANTPLSLTPSPSPTASPTSSPTVAPTSAATSTPSSSTPPTTSTPNQTASASLQNPKSIYEILIAALVILIVAFVVVMAVFMRGKRR